MKNHFFLLAIVLLLASCDTTHTFSQLVNNSSSETITLYFSGESLRYYPDSVVLNSNTEQVIYEYNAIGGEPEGFGCNIQGGSVEVVVSGARELTKDIKVDSNWEQNLSGKKTVKEVCIFRIGEEDIQ